MPRLVPSASVTGDRRKPAARRKPARGRVASAYRRQSRLGSPTNSSDPRWEPKSSNVSNTRPRPERFATSLPRAHIGIKDSGEDRDHRPNSSPRATSRTCRPGSPTDIRLTQSTSCRHGGGHHCPGRNASNQQQLLSYSVTSADLPGPRIDLYAQTPSASLMRGFIAALTPGRAGRGGLGG